MIANDPILQQHIIFINEACDYWLHELITAQTQSMANFARTTVPKTPGVYIIRQKTEIVYVGKSNNLCNRICSNHLAPRMRSSTLRRKVSKHLSTKDETLITDWLITTNIGWIALGDHRLTVAVEDHVIEKLNPPFNGYT